MCERCKSPALLAELFARAEVTCALAEGAAATAAAMNGAASAPGVCLPSTPTDARRPAAGAMRMPARRARKLWELEERYHCPVIGTCLSLGELRKLARKLGFSGNAFDDYRLHVEAVSLSLTRNEVSQALHKLLDRKFALYLKRFAGLADDDAVRAAWRSHFEQGEVAGAMWAAMTHRHASAATRQSIYQDVHMLSHQVGAAQAADLRRQEWLERQRAELLAENARLREQRERQAEELRALAQERDALREQNAHLEPLLRRVRELESGQAMVALGRRLMLAEAQAGKARELEGRVRALEQRIGQLRADKARLTRELEESSSERDALERLWLADAPDAGCDGDCAVCPGHLQGRCVLCVGGRTPLLPQYRQLAERLGVRLLHHDGGREAALSRLPDLLAQSDAVICPTDTVSHLAYYQLKKHCKQTGKPCVLSKSSGVAGFATALTRLASGRAEIAGTTSPDGFGPQPAHAEI